MLNRILGRTKAKELTSEEIQQIAGAGCHTEYVTTGFCRGASSVTIDPNETCYDPTNGNNWTYQDDPYQVCN